jgi:uncharacterized damage-inducible protein DinB
MKHIIIAIKSQTEYVLEGRNFDPRELVKYFEEYEQLNMTKAEILSELNNAFDKLIRKLGSMSDADFGKKFKLPFSESKPQSFRVLAMFVRDHITHHRAQAIIYLRMNGIEPAFYQPF